MSPPPDLRRDEASLSHASAGARSRCHGGAPSGRGHARPVHRAPAAGRILPALDASPAPLCNCWVAPRIRPSTGEVTSCAPARLGQACPALRRPGGAAFGCAAPAAERVTTPRRQGRGPRGSSARAAERGMPRSLTSGVGALIESLALRDAAPRCIGAVAPRSRCRVQRGAYPAGRGIAMHRSSDPAAGRSAHVDSISGTCGRVHSGATSGRVRDRGPPQAPGRPRSARASGRRGSGPSVTGSHGRCGASRVSRPGAGP